MYLRVSRSGGGGGRYGKGEITMEEWIRVCGMEGWGMRDGGSMVSRGMEGRAMWGGIGGEGRLRCPQRDEG